MNVPISTPLMDELNRILCGELELARLECKERKAKEAEGREKE